MGRRAGEVSSERRGADGDGKEVIGRVWSEKA